MSKENGYLVGLGCQVVELSCFVSERSPFINRELSSTAKLPQDQVSLGLVRVLCDATAAPAPSSSLGRTPTRLWAPGVQLLGKRLLPLLLQQVELWLEKDQFSCFLSGNLSNLPLWPGWSNNELIALCLGTFYRSPVNIKHLI